MTEIYAASLSLAQGSEGTTVSASLLMSADGQCREVSLEWPNLGDINANGDVTEWLYSALSRLVTNYDEHRIKTTSITPTISV